MNKMMKRIVSMMLAVVMCFGLVDVRAFADTEKNITVYFDNGIGTWTDGVDDATQKQYVLYSTTADAKSEAPSVVAPANYEFSHWENNWGDDSKLSANGKFSYNSMKDITGEPNNEAYIGWTAKYKEIKRTVTVNFNVDSTKGEFTEYGVGPVTFNELDEFTGEGLVPAVTAKEGYKFVGWTGEGATTIEWGADTKTFGVAGLAHFAEGSTVGYVTLTAKFEKVEAPKPEKRTVTVNFNVDPAKGEFTEYGAGPVTYENLDEFTGEGLVPAVTAKEGYKFVGWTGEGATTIEWGVDAKTFGVAGLAHFAEGSTVGYVTLTAKFEKVETAPATKQIFVKFVDEEGNHVHTAGKTIVVDADKTYAHTSLTEDQVPAGYEIAIAGDIPFGGEYGDEMVVVVRKAAPEAPATKQIYVVYNDEKGNFVWAAGKTLVVAADATYVNTSVLEEIPAGYELALIGDLPFDGDMLYVTVRKVNEEKATKQIYVVFEDRNGEFVEALGYTLVVDADATYANTSILNYVPENYKIAITGDITFEGEFNDMMYVTVEKVEVDEDGDDEVVVEPEKETSKKKTAKAIPDTGAMDYTGFVVMAMAAVVLFVVRKVKA